MNRRSFLKSVSGAAVAAVAAPAILPALDSLGALPEASKFAGPSSGVLTFIRPDEFPLDEILRRMEQQGVILAKDYKTVPFEQVRF